MNEKYVTGQKEKWVNELLIMVLLLAFAFFINRGIQIKGLYMDDLYLWSCYGEQSFFQYIFPVGSTRFRFLYYLASYLELGLVGTHISWLVPINIVLNGLIAYTIVRFGRRLARSQGIGFLCGIAYLLSRMSYYQISQVYGLMETMALWAAIGILYCVFRYVNDEEEKTLYFILANVLYFAISFIHERYMLLLPLLLLALLLKRKKQWKLWLLAVANFGMIQVIRILTIGTLAPAGTGGTDVADTFHIMDALKYAVSQVLYVFGINAGPEHLNGRSFGDSPSHIQMMVLAADVLLLILVVAFLITIIRGKGKRGTYLSNCLLFGVFIAMCIGSSSVTVRVELRWVYVSFAAALLFMAYMYGAITEQIPQEAAAKRFLPWGLLCLLYVALMFPTETYYRSQFPNIYLWPNQLRYNSLAEETYEKYGEDIFGKKIYIIGNSYEMSDFTARTFLKVYDKERKAEGTQILFIDSIRDIGQVTDRMLILREDPSHNAFQDVTSFVRNLKCEPVYGYYRDGWMDEEAGLNVMAGSTGTIELELLYPGRIMGQEQSVIHMDGEEVMTVQIKENTMYLKLQTEPYQVVNLTFHNNFYMQDAQEQRGDKKLSMIVNLTTD